jgi:hypothetical protein
VTITALAWLFLRLARERREDARQSSPARP